MNQFQALMYSALIFIMAFALFFTSSVYFIFGAYDGSLGYRVDRQLGHYIFPTYFLGFYAAKILTMRVK